MAARAEQERIDARRRERAEKTPSGASRWLKSAKQAPANPNPNSNDAVTAGGGRGQHSVAIPHAASATGIAAAAARPTTAAVSKGNRGGYDPFVAPSRPPAGGVGAGGSVQSTVRVPPALSRSSDVSEDVSSLLSDVSEYDDGLLGAAGGDNRALPPSSSSATESDSDFSEGRAPRGPAVVLRGVDRYCDTFFVRSSFLSCSSSLSLFYIFLSSSYIFLSSSYTFSLPQHFSLFLHLSLFLHFFLFIDIYLSSYILFFVLVPVTLFPYLSLLLFLSF